MTPLQIITVARNRRNAISDTFYSDAELYEYLYDGTSQLAKEALVIQCADTSISTVIGTQEYAFPTNIIDIKRLTYNGQKLRPINFREDDAITGLNQSSTSQGTPQYYYQWNYTIGLRPIPNAVQTLKIYGNKLETYPITAAMTLLTPVEFHMDLADYVTAIMCMKDTDSQMGVLYEQKWLKSVLRAKAWIKRRDRTDSFRTVLDEEQLIGSYLGPL